MLALVANEANLISVLNGSSVPPRRLTAPPVRILLCARRCCTQSAALKRIRRRVPRPFWDVRWSPERRINRVSFLQTVLQSANRNKIYHKYHKSRLTHVSNI